MQPDFIICLVSIYAGRDPVQSSCQAEGALDMSSKQIQILHVQCLTTDFEICKAEDVSAVPCRMLSIMHTLHLIHMSATRSSLQRLVVTLHC